MPLQIRRGTEAERQALTSVNGLVIGELLYVTDDQKLYIGNGTTPGGVVATTYNDNDAKAAAGESITTGTHEYINFTYNPVTRTISSTLSLSDYQGSIKASSFKGSLLADDGSSLSGVTLVDATNGSINLDGTVKGNIVPDLNIAYDIGTNLLRFRDLYLSGSTIYLGNASISSSGSIVNLPAGSTVGGVPIGTGTGSGDGVIEGTNYNISIVGANSTIIVDADQNKFIGTLEGDVVGSVFNDNSVLLLSGIDPYISNGIVSISDNSITSSVAASEIQIANSLVVDDDGISLISNSSIPYMEVFLKNTAGSVSNYLSYAYRGTNTAPTALSNGDSIWSQSWLAYDGSTYIGSAALEIQVDTVATGNAPAKIFLVTIPNNNVANAKGIQITETGVSINTGFTPPAATLDINGFAKLAILTAEPASPADGMVAIADGVSWNPTSTGKQTMVVRLGSNWIQMAVAP